ncbi:MAG TPA: lysylphosphatidylglycerol synthase transmembrane domain-containing protein [Alphaproteobacteria bacterium]|nr:lysylphosphatidylglycerol synthase transmembrane domain-containing protein [Alphaproteobacteria bacterium]
MWRFLAKGAISVLLIWLLLRNRDLGALLRQMLAVHRDALALAALLLWSLAIPSAQRWSKVLEAMGKRLPFRKTFPLVLIGLFFNLTLPSSVGGDAVRMWKAHRAGLDGATAIVSVMIDRLVALVALFLLVAAAMPIMFAIVEDQRARTGVILLLALGFVGLPVGMMLDRLPAALQRFKLVRGLTHLSASLRHILITPRWAVPTLLLSLVNQGGNILVVYILAIGLGIGVDWRACLLIVPLTLLVSVLPISIAGWGVREGAFVAGFGMVGVASQQALALSVLFGLLGIIISLPGGIVWLAMGDRRIAMQPLGDKTGGGPPAAASNS